MTDLIFCLLFLTYPIMAIALFVIAAVHLKKEKTSRYYKINRNISALICLNAIIAFIFLPTFSLSYIMYPIAAVPIWLSATISCHKAMINTQEIEIMKEKFFKTQPIDVEYKELN